MFKKKSLPSKGGACGKALEWSLSYNQEEGRKETRSKSGNQQRRNLRNRKFPFQSLLGYPAASLHTLSIQLLPTQAPHSTPLSCLYLHPTTPGIRVIAPGRLTPLFPSTPVTNAIGTKSNYTHKHAQRQKRGSHRLNRRCGPLLKAFVAEASLGIQTTKCRRHASKRCARRSPRPTQRRKSPLKDTHGNKACSTQDTSPEYGRSLLASNGGQSSR